MLFRSLRPADQLIATPGEPILARLDPGAKLQLIYQSLELVDGARPIYLVSYDGSGAPPTLLNARAPRGEGS